MDANFPIGLPPLYEGAQGLAHYLTAQGDYSVT